MQKKYGRREILAFSSTIATALLVENLLIGCKARDSSARVLDAGSGPGPGPVTPPELFPVLTAGPLLAIRDKIAANPESFPDIALANGAVLQGAAPPKVALLYQLLVLYQVQKNSFGVMDELLEANVDLLALPGFVYPGANPILPPVMVVSHELVTGEALSDANSGLYSLGAYAPEMPYMLGHFLLCDEDAERHDLEKKLMSEVMRPTNAAAFASMLDKIAADLVEKKLGRAAGSDSVLDFDIVQDLTRHLPLKVISRYIGIPLKTAADETRLYEQTSALFHNFLLNQRREAPITEAGRKAGYALLSDLVKLIEPKLKRRPAKRDTVLDRLVHAWFDDKQNPVFSPHVPVPVDSEGNQHPLYQETGSSGNYGTALRIASLIAGALTPAAVAPEEGIARVFNVLLQPENSGHLKKAIAIARTAGNEVAGTLSRYVNEAMRHQPQTEIIPRVLTEDTEVAGKKLHKGQMVFVCLYAAMRDRRIMNNPAAFDPDRPEREVAAARLQFGTGRHTCLGNHLATAQATAALKAVLSKVANDISLAPGAALEFNLNGRGPFALSLKTKIS